MTKPEERRTASGRTLTDAEVEALAAEVEQADYDVEALKARRRGRPPMGSGPADVVPVRMGLNFGLRSKRARPPTRRPQATSSARHCVSSSTWPRESELAEAADVGVVDGLEGGDAVPDLGRMPWVYRDLWRAERAERLGRTLGVPELTIRRPVALIGKGSGGFRHRAGRQGGPPVCRRGLSRPPSSSSDRATGGNPRTAGSMA